MRTTLVANPSDARTRDAMLTPLALVVLTLATRLPLRGHLLYHWDSVNFAFALDRFDIATGRPHAPGYLLYVLLGRATAWLTGSAQSAFVLLAALGSALAAVALYDLGRRLWDARAGLVAACLLISSPLFWFYGEVALPHSIDALMVIVAATLSWRVWQGEQRIAPLLALWLGVAGGLRQQTLVFMFPLAVVACARLPWRAMLWSMVILGTTVLAWIVPLFALTGGMERYFGIVASYSEHFDRPTSVLLGAGWKGLLGNADKLARYTLWGWSLGLVLALAGCALLRPAPRALLRDRRTWLLLLWALPCLAFYTLIHMGQQGLVFVFLPVLLLLSARGAVAVVDRWRAGRWLVLAALAGQALLFLLTPQYVLPGRFKVLSLATVRAQDRLLQAQIDVVRDGLPPGAVLLADQWRFPQYFLPEAPLVAYRVSEGDETAVRELDPDTRKRLMEAPALAWYEPVVETHNRAPERTQTRVERDGVRLRVIERAPDEHFWIDATGFGVEGPTR